VAFLVARHRWNNVGPALTASIEQRWSRRGNFAAAATVGSRALNYVVPTLLVNVKTTSSKLRRANGACYRGSVLSRFSFLPCSIPSTHSVRENVCNPSKNVQVTFQYVENQ